MTGDRQQNSFSGHGARDEPRDDLWRSGHGKGTDWWALGVLICELLTSKPPWSGNNRAKLHEQILTGPLHLPKHLSSHARHIIVSLLKRPLDKRLGCGPEGVNAIKAHPFYHGINWEKLGIGRSRRPGSPLSDTTGTWACSTPCSQGRRCATPPHPTG